MADGLVTVVWRRSVARESLDEKLDRLEDEGRLEEALALLNGLEPKTQLFAGARLTDISTEEAS